MRRRLWATIAAVGLAAALGGGALWIRTRGAESGPGPGIVTASGRIESREVRVAALTGGRILRLEVEEGDSVRAGQVLALLDRRSLDAAVAGTRAAVDAALANVVAAERAIAALESQRDLARREAERYRRLFEHDAAPRQAAEQAEAALSRLNNETRAAVAGRELAARQVEVAWAQLRTAEVQAGEATVTAPAAGLVEAALVRPGEIVAPGMPLLVLREAEEPKLSLYLPLAEGERVRPGMEARIYVDALPERFFPGRVVRVASEAEFTPRDVHMPDERATLVFAVDLRVPNPGGLLKNGFPADAYIRLDPGSPWPERPPW